MHDRVVNSNSTTCSVHKHQIDRFFIVRKDVEGKWFLPINRKIIVIFL